MSGSHCLIVGTTESGKTTLARLLARRSEKNKRRVMVYDPMLSEWCESAEVFGDFDEMLHALSDAGDVDIYIDEADTCLSMSHRANWWLLTRGRHFGYRVTMITQRPTLVAPTVRGMASSAYCFRVSSSDAALMGSDYTSEDMREAATLEQGGFFWVRWADGERKTTRHNIFRKRIDKPAKTE